MCRVNMSALTAHPWYRRANFLHSVGRKHFIHHSRNHFRRETTLFAQSQCVEANTHALGISIYPTLDKAYIESKFYKGLEKPNNPMSFFSVVHLYGQCGKSRSTRRQTSLFVCSLPVRCPVKRYFQMVTLTMSLWCCPRTHAYKPLMALDRLLRFNFIIFLYNFELRIDILFLHFNSIRLFPIATHIHSSSNLAVNQ